MNNKGLKTIRRPHGVPAECPLCKNPFVMTPSRHKYCSDKCKGMSLLRRKRMAAEQPEISKDICTLCLKTRVVYKLCNTWFCDICLTEKEVSRALKGFQIYYGEDSAKLAKLMCEQKALCRICRRRFTSRAKCCIDHDHVTGKVRGLLCHGCNTALGHFGEDPNILQAAMDYLKEEPVETGIMYRGCRDVS